MTIEQIDSSKVLVALCNQDMKDYELEFDSMGFENTHSKKILNRLITMICNKTGLSTNNKRLLMEALPHQNGCLILVTFMEKHISTRVKYRIKKPKETTCFCFEETDDFLKAISLIYKENIYVRSSKAYLFKKEYYLVFDSHPIPHIAKRILNEYGKRRKCTKAFLSALKEAGKTICEKNAVDTIGKAFS